MSGRAEIPAPQCWLIITGYFLLNTHVDLAFVCKTNFHMKHPVALVMTVCSAESKTTGVDKCSSSACPPVASVSAADQLGTAHCSRSTKAVYPKLCNGL